MLYLPPLFEETILCCCTTLDHKQALEKAESDDVLVEPELVPGSSNADRKQAPEKIKSVKDMVEPELVPGSSNDGGNHHGNQETVAVEEDQDKIEEKQDAKRIKAILEELPSKNVDEIAKSFTELADLMCSPKHPKVKQANRVIMQETAVHGVVVFLMTYHKDKRSIQQEGMRVLHNFISNYPDKNVAQNCVANVGAIKVAIDAMKRFVDHLLTQRNGCGFFVNLSYGPLNVKRRILDEGIVAPICKAMKTHSDDRKTQLWGCGVLDNLKNSFPEETKQAIWAVKGVSAIVEAREHHQDDDEIKALANRVLEGLFD